MQFLRRFWLPLLFFFGVAALPHAASAVPAWDPQWGPPPNPPQSPDGVVDAVQQAAQGWVDTLSNMAQIVFGLLIIIDFTWTIATFFLSGRENLGEFMAQWFLKLLGFVVIYYLVLKHGWEISQHIIDSFLQVGNRLNGVHGGPVTQAPSFLGLVGEGFGIVMPMMLQAIVFAFIPNVFVAVGMTNMQQPLLMTELFGVMAVMGAYVLMAGALVLAWLEMYIVTSIGVLMLGFSGSRWTQSMGWEKYLTYSFSIGVKLLMTYICIDIGRDIGSSVIAKGLVPGVGAIEAGFEAGIITMIVYNVPNFAASLIQGSSSASAGAAMSFAQSMSGSMLQTAQMASQSLQQAAATIQQYVSYQRSQQEALPAAIILPHQRNDRTEFMAAPPETPLSAAVDGGTGVSEVGIAGAMQPGQIGAGARTPEFDQMVTDGVAGALSAPMAKYRDAQRERDAALWDTLAQNGADQAQNGDAAAAFSGEPTPIARAYNIEGESAPALVLGDGVVVTPSRAMVSPDSTVQYQDGTVAFADGTTVSPDGARMTPGGVLLRADGTYELPVAAEGGNTAEYQAFAMVTGTAERERQIAQTARTLDEAAKSSEGTVQGAQAQPQPQTQTYAGAEQIRTPDAAVVENEASAQQVVAADEQRALDAAAFAPTGFGFDSREREVVPVGREELEEALRNYEAPPSLAPAAATISFSIGKSAEPPMPLETTVAQPPQRVMGEPGGYEVAAALPPSNAASDFATTTRPQQQMPLETSFAQPAAALPPSSAASGFSTPASPQQQAPIEAVFARAPEPPPPPPASLPPPSTIPGSMPGSVEQAPIESVFARPIERPAVEAPVYEVAAALPPTSVPSRVVREASDVDSATSHSGRFEEPAPLPPPLSEGVARQETIGTRTDPLAARVERVEATEVRSERVIKRREGGRAPEAPDDDDEVALAGGVAAVRPEPSARATPADMSSRRTLLDADRLPEDVG